MTFQTHLTLLVTSPCLTSSGSWWGGEEKKIEGNEKRNPLIYTAQMILNTSVAHLAATQHMHVPLGVNRKTLFVRKEPM